MRIDPLVNHESTTPSYTLTRPLLRVGAILEAVAIRDVARGELWLQLDNQQRLPARLASGAEPGPAHGEVLRLRVLRDSPVLAFETLHDELPRNDVVATDALRRVLPQQASPTPLLANLAWLIRRPEQLARLPPVIQRGVQELWQRLPDATQLTDASELHAALMHSGTFLEAELLGSQDAPATMQAILEQDYKAALLWLRMQLRQLNVGLPAQPAVASAVPSLSGHVQPIAMGPASLAAVDTSQGQLAELKQQVDASTARVQTNQLLNEQAAMQGQSCWIIEVPVRHQHNADLLRFKFEREPRNITRAGETWQVEVALDLGSLGSLHAQLQWHSTEGLSVKLRSDSALLVAALNQDLDQLGSALSAQGITVNRLLCLHGLPVDGAVGRLNKLLDLHA